MWIGWRQEELSPFYRQGDAPGVGITDVQVTAEKLVVNTGIVAGWDCSREARFM